MSSSRSWPMAPSLVSELTEQREDAIDADVGKLEDALNSDLATIDIRIGQVENSLANLNEEVEAAKQSTSRNIVSHDGLNNALQNELLPEWVKNELYFFIEWVVNGAHSKDAFTDSFPNSIETPNDMSNIYSSEGNKPLRYLGPITTDFNTLSKVISHDGNTITNYSIYQSNMPEGRNSEDYDMFERTELYDYISIVVNPNIGIESPTHRVSSLQNFIDLQGFSEAELAIAAEHVEKDFFGHYLDLESERVQRYKTRYDYTNFKAVQPRPVHERDIHYYAKLNRLIEKDDVSLPPITFDVSNIDNGNGRVKLTSRSNANIVVGPKLFNPKRILSFDQTDRIEGASTTMYDPDNNIFHDPNELLSENEAENMYPNDQAKQNYVSRRYPVKRSGDVEFVRNLNL